MNWPGQAPAAVAITVDFDADVGLGWRGLAGTDRLTARSEAEYGAARGIQRLADLLAARDLAATFYVPGEIAVRHPDRVRALRDAGHDIGHHGYAHLWKTAFDERDEVLRGIEAIERVVGDRPAGYRSPGWELSATTLALLVAEGFHFDSSLMGDDRPYRAVVGDLSILEFPVHWSLDDWVYFGFTRDGGGVMQAPGAMLDTWRREVASAIGEHRMVTLTVHPEVTGRGYRADLLSELIDWMRDRQVWVTSHAAIADHLAATGQLPDGSR